MAPLIVLIPGLMNDGWVWRKQLPALSRLGPVVVARNDGHDTLAGMARDILDRSAGPLAVVGHSMGGRVALEIARAAPERIARLALLDTGANAAADAEAAARMALVDLARREGMDAMIDAWLPQMLAPDVPRGGPLWNGIADMLKRASPDILERQQRALIVRHDANDVLGNLEVPVALVVGEHDGWSTPDQHRQLAARLKRPALTVIEGAGHMTPIERPTGVTAALMKWLGA